ncbi:hypothetical protein H5410_041226 [Solanum commersonii]|uniref:Uncharacterized protein n=1 Tax=Solanum commersonii TaxID=4109 RepID=A0A9J5XU68_SOLCO|nr:hypothetical protein H5410_041226 [Solanum commersonii]
MGRNGIYCRRSSRTIGGGDLNYDTKGRGEIHQWNGRIEDRYIFKRPDKILINQAFIESFPSSEVHHLITQGSNHGILHIIFTSEEEPTKEYWNQKIGDEVGDFVTTKQQIGEEVVDIFSKQFTEKVFNHDFSMLQNILQVITKDQNKEIIKLPILEEIEEVVFELNEDSDSGTDGFSI